MEKLKLSLIVLFIFLSLNAYSQTGTISFNADGIDHSLPLKSISESNTFQITAGLEAEFGITIMWKETSSPSEIKPGSYDLPPENNEVIIGYVDYKTGTPYVIKAGKFTVTESTGKAVKGTFNFEALAGGIPSELGGRSLKISNGKFEIEY